MSMETPAESPISSKEAAGARAALCVESGMTLGLGTGSTVTYFLEALARRIQSENLLVKGVATSEDTVLKAKELGIPMTTLEEDPQLDLVIDGADEVDGDFRLIKGGGGALLREKIVAAAGKRVVIIVGEGKQVNVLGTTFLLPIEILPFGYPSTKSRVAELGCIPFLRTTEKEEPFVTDNGNYILDCKFAEGIADPVSLHAEISQIPGVAEVGLFLDLCDEVITGLGDGTTTVQTK
jgi:ribose 5-phosphate isomerase A